MDEVMPKERIKKFNKQNRNDLIATGQERLLSLRKKKINQYIDEKRMLNHNPHTKFEISLEEINLDSETKNSFLLEFQQYVRRKIN